MRTRDGRRGFALPMVIFVIAFLTVSLAAATAFSSSERRVVENTAAQVDAFSVAQTGLELFLGNRSGLGFTATPPAAYESTTVSVAGGSAYIVLQRLRPAGAGIDPLYVVRSRGVVSGRVLSGTPAAQRLVAQYVTWQTGSIQARAGWSSLTGMIKNGGAGTLSGVDNCGDSASVAGVSVGPPGYTQSGGGTVPNGSPPIETFPTTSDAADAVKINWRGILDGTALVPTVHYNTDGWPSFDDPAFWPTIRVDGNFTLPTSGRGILIVTGNLVISGGLNWDGIILVGQNLRSDGNNSVYGTTFAGLNVKLTSNPDSAAAAIGVSDVGNGTKTFRYDSCNIRRALSGFGGLIPLQNAWLDNWPLY